MNTNKNIFLVYIKEIIMKREEIKKKIKMYSNVSFLYIDLPTNLIFFVNLSITFNL